MNPEIFGAAIKGVLTNKYLRRFLALLAVVAALIWIGIESSLIPAHADICSKNEYTGNKECATYHITLVALWHFGRLLEDHAGAITAIATVLIGYFTYTLYQATDQLKTLAKQQEKSTRIHERAYLFGGGPTRRQEPRQLVSKDWIFVDVDPPDVVCMTISNWGRSTGFIKKVQWGLCPKDKFREDISVGKLIRGDLLPSETVQTVVKDDIYPPTGKDSIAYRHVSFKMTENIGKIFFGKLFFEDIFGDPHHSTFKLEIVTKGSEPLEGCYSDDWG